MIVGSRLPAPPAVPHLVADDVTVAMPPNDPVLHHDTADLRMAVPVPCHGRLRRHDRHRASQHRGPGQGKEELLHGKSGSSAPVPSSKYQGKLTSQNGCTAP